MPVALTGDFNAREGSAPYAVLAKAFSDALYASEQPHEGPTSTWNGFEAIAPGARIDYIFVGEGVSVYAHRILPDMTAEGRFPSDHLPALAEIGLEE